MGKALLLAAFMLTAADALGGISGGTNFVGEDGLGMSPEEFAHFMREGATGQGPDVRRGQVPSAPRPESSPVHK